MYAFIEKSIKMKELILVDMQLDYVHKNVKQHIF